MDRIAYKEAVFKTEGQYSESDSTVLRHGLHVQDGGDRPSGLKGI
jgi:hypothetical protein